jgi:hypothetical protein
MWRGAGDEFLDEDAVVAEGAFGFGAHSRKAFFHFLAIVRDADALAAAAGARLDHHRVADLFGDLHGVLDAGDFADEARHTRDARFGGGLLGFDLVAHGADGVRIGADENDLFGDKAIGELGFLGEEAEARVDGLRAGLLAGGDDLVDDEIGLRGGRRADEDGSSAISTARLSASASE